jgi:hypothetical protein
MDIAFRSWRGRQRSKDNMHEHYELSRSVKTLTTISAALVAWPATDVLSRVEWTEKCLDPRPSRMDTTEKREYLVGLIHLANGKNPDLFLCLVALPPIRFSTATSCDNGG